jgi:hypothetical protein
MGATFFGVPSESGDYKKYGYENFQMDQNPTKSHNDFSGLRQLSQKLDMRFNRKKNNRMILPSLFLFPTFCVLRTAAS